jgi:hypothetical protein
LILFNKYKCNVFQKFQPLSYSFLEHEYKFSDIKNNFCNLNYLFRFNKSIARFLIFLNSQHFCYYNFSFFFFKGNLKYYITTDLNNCNFLSFKSLKKLYFIL